MLKQKFSFFFFFFLIALSGIAQPTAKQRMRVLFVPLDDRPPCYQFTERMAMIGDVDLHSAPKNLLGRFTSPGQSDNIIEWLKSQDLNSYDAAIVAVDMLSYGGLVASRVYNVDADKALQRVIFLQQIRKRFPKLKIYAQNVIMRLAPTSDGKNEAYRADLAKWAEASSLHDQKSKELTKTLESSIPKEGLENYKSARKRNLQVNLKAIEFVNSGIFDYLILSQDDAKPVGIHVADRVRLEAEIKKRALQNKIALQPGADEVSMLLLSRALNDYYKLSPRVKAIYSSDKAANSVMPFEDKPLRETVSRHIKSTGCREVKEEKDADLLFYVFASRKVPGAAETFAAEIERKIQQRNKVMVADIDPVGDVQGGDSIFTRALISRKLFPELNSYASWNTAANTIGTTLPQGVIFHAAEKKLLTNPSAAERIWTAQNWFTLHRVIDDYYFHGLNRLQVNKYFNQQKLSSKTLDNDLNAKVEAYGTSLMLQSFNEFAAKYFNKRAISRQENVICRQPSDFKFTLPWNRTFEAEIFFRLSCTVIK